MASLAPTLKALITSIPSPVDRETLDKLVNSTIQESRSQVPAENRKSQWEYLLRNEIFILAANEGSAPNDPETKYYAELQDKLDLVLTFTEHDACEATFPFTVLQDLLETQTISSCSHIFSWIELRAPRLTEGMVPQKGKALILLRTLNDLLRRLSKMGSTTIFCGRILTFLSGVFPLGERSGVNLRGEYGPTWEGVEDKQESESMSIPGIKEKDSGDADKMEVDEVKVEGDKKPSQGEDGSTKSAGTFMEFKESVNKALPVIREATTKERAMMGSRSAGSSGIKRKREVEAPEESSASEYFFAKFLTSPDLLELEIADTHFRRQFLFQLLILLNHLAAFTPAAKANWASSRNRSLQMEFSLEGADAQWVQETITKATDELRQTAPNGPAFKETINTILEREKNWIKWKNNLCLPFDKEPWGVTVEGREGKVGLEEATREVRVKMSEPPKPWPWDLGTEPLSDIWTLGYRTLEDLENPFQPGDVKDFVKKIKLEDMRITQRKTFLSKQAERVAQARAKAAAAAAAPPSPAKEPGTPKATTLSATDVGSPSAPLSGARSPLQHPLPAKPLITPAKAEDGPSGKPIVATPLAVPTATATPPSHVPVPTPPPAATSLPPDDQINKYEENKQRWTWLALRNARDQYLQHFGKIGTGDVILLQQQIDDAATKEKEDREKVQKGEELTATLDVGASRASEDRGASPLIPESSAGVDAEPDKMTSTAEGKDTSMEKADVAASDSQGDVKMENLTADALHTTS
ncbi:hypothetical protein HWV62_28664 [Athelia sp. TMB]|nr:hypothetical protein HWV62_28664 [Athelia sp. TMB]